MREERLVSRYLPLHWQGLALPLEGAPAGAPPSIMVLTIGMLFDVPAPSSSVRSPPIFNDALFVIEDKTRLHDFIVMSA